MDVPKVVIGTDALKEMTAVGGGHPSFIRDMDDKGNTIMVSYSPATLQKVEGTVAIGWKAASLKSSQFGIAMGYDVQLAENGEVRIGHKEHNKFPAPINIADIDLRKLVATVEELKKENDILKSKIFALEETILCAPGGEFAEQVKKDFEKKNTSIVNFTDASLNKVLDGQ